jgi:phosphatidylserine decarboxylase
MIKSVFHVWIVAVATLAAHLLIVPPSVLGKEPIASEAIVKASDASHPRIAAGLKKLREKVNKLGDVKYGGAVQKFADLIESDGVVRMYVNEMIADAAVRDKSIDSPEVMLKALHLIIQEAPSFAEGDYFPMSTLFVYMMDTPAGRAAFAYPKINDALRAILKQWCAFLDSRESLSVINKKDGWLSPKAFQVNALDDCIIPNPSDPHGGFLSFNDFFHRKIKPELRPIAAPDDPKIIISANDGAVYAVASDVKLIDAFWIKNQKYSLYDMLDGSPFSDRFVGGHVIQSFLSGNDYHRYHAPIDGTVKDVRIVDGLMFSELDLGVFDTTSGTLSQGYQASVNTRGLLFIESEDPKIGLVVMIPIGITEVSSVSFSVKKGDKLKKGQEVGYFSYGGSSMCLVFQPGAIKRFNVTPSADVEAGDGPKIRVNQELAIAN